MKGEIHGVFNCSNSYSNFVGTNNESPFRGLIKGKYLFI